jgi:perosamine synthetase
MNIFNSLGSNYDGTFVWQSIILPGSKRTTDIFRQKLAEQFQGSAVLTYKGRQALELALKASGLPQGSAVGLNGFTCYALYQAIERAGYRPVSIDVAPGTLNFGVDELQSVHADEPKLKAIIVQNTLGLPADMPALKTYCQKHDILIIEDLAHSLGSIYADGQEAGTVGRFTMLSFSQDKPLDVVAGGAVIDRRKNPKDRIEQPKRRVSLWQRDVNSLYPFWTSLIRNLYPIRLGRYLHFGLKKLHLLATPMSDNLQGLSTMEPWAVRLLLKRWNDRQAELEHRRTIAKTYAELLPKSLQFTPLTKTKPSYLRFPIKVDDRASLVAHLKSKGVHIGDTWYDAPIAPARYLNRTNYTDGECPNAEDLAGHIVNLPTHMHVNQASSSFIAEEIKSWLQSP